MKLKGASYLNRIHAVFTAEPHIDVGSGDPVWGGTNVEFTLTPHIQALVATPHRITTQYQDGVFSVPIRGADQITASDVAALGLSIEGEHDAVYVVEWMDRVLGRVLADLVTFEGVISWGMDRRMTDIARAVDTTSFSWGRVSSVTSPPVPITSTPLLGFTGAQNDGAMLDDNVLRGIGVRPSDTPTMFDGVAMSVATVHRDSLSASDDPTFRWERYAPMIDTVSAATALFKNVGLLTSNIITVGDVFEAEIFAGQRVYDTVVLPLSGEAVYKAVTRFQGDAAVVGDTGELHNQGYADVAYFSEDYVGETRTI